MADKCEVPSAGMFNRQPGNCKRKATAIIIFKGARKKACNQCKSAGQFVRKI